MARKRLESILARHRLGESTPRRESGVDDGTRTHDKKNRCSIQMSYGRRQLRLDARRPCPKTRRLCIPRGTTSSHTKVVGVEGFEPTTSCSQSRRATRLRY